MESLIDTHGYIGHNPFSGITVTPDYYRILREKLMQDCIDAKFLIMPYTRQGDLGLPGVVKEHSDIFLGGILQFNPNRDLEGKIGYISPQELERIIKEGDIVGLKLVTSFARTRVDDPGVDDFARLALDYGIPIIFHCASSAQEFAHPDYFRRLKDRIPDLKVVCAHFGGLNVDFIPGYVNLVREYNDIFLNTAGLSGQIERYDLGSSSVIRNSSNHETGWEKIFLEAVPLIEDKVVFGSDEGELRFSLHPVDKASPEVRRKVYCDNAVRMFHLSNLPAHPLIQRQ